VILLCFSLVSWQSNGYWFIAKGLMGEDSADKSIEVSFKRLVSEKGLDLERAFIFLTCAVSTIPINNRLSLDLFLVNLFNYIHFFNFSDEAVSQVEFTPKQLKNKAPGKGPSKRTKRVFRGVSESTLEELKKTSSQVEEEVVQVIPEKVDKVFNPPEKKVEKSNVFEHQLADFGFSPSGGSN
jgi:hypothetical protein